MVEFRGGATAEQAFETHEHHDLAPGVARTHAAARAGGTTPGDWSKAVLDVVDWVETVLQSRAAREDAWLHREITRRTGTRWATTTAAEAGTRARSS